MVDWDTLVMKILRKEKELKMTRKILNSECRYGICKSMPPPLPPPSPHLVRCKVVYTKLRVSI